MTNEEFIELKSKDTYLVPRKAPLDWELRLFLREVDFHCPLCGKELQSRTQKKLSEKKFQVAHIYPNSPTQEQYETLQGLERLGDNCESFDNKIALCKDCHGTQDFHTTAREYLRLLEIKKRKLQDTLLHDIAYNLSLEKDIELVVEQITKIDGNDLAVLNYNPVPLTKKFYPNENLLATKILGYVSLYFPYIRDLFRDMDGKNGFLFTVLSSQIKACFQKLEAATKNKTLIFTQLVDWLELKTLADSREACEAIISFFIQHCEVFYEITE